MDASTFLGARISILSENSAWFFLHCIVDDCDPRPDCGLNKDKNNKIENMENTAWKSRKNDYHGSV